MQSRIKSTLSSFITLGTRENLNLYCSFSPGSPYLRPNGRGTNSSKSGRPCFQQTLSVYKLILNLNGKKELQLPQLLRNHSCRLTSMKTEPSLMWLVTPVISCYFIWKWLLWKRYIGILSEPSNVFKDALCSFREIINKLHLKDNTVSHCFTSFTFSETF